MEENKTERQKELDFNKYGLNIKQDKFCKLYTSTNIEMFGNGVISYIEAYDPDTKKPNWYQTAGAASSRLLKNVKIIDRINGLLEQQGFNDENVEKQHLFLLNQHTDLKTKMKAIDGYYKLRGKNQPDKLVVTTKDKEKTNDVINKFLNGNSKDNTREE